MSRKPPEYKEKYGVIVISNLYSIDLLEDNVEECRERLLKIFEKPRLLFQASNTNSINVSILKHLKFILNKNIISGDAITMKITKANL